MLKNSGKRYQNKTRKKIFISESCSSFFYFQTMLFLCTENQYKITHFELDHPILYNKRDLSSKNWRN